MTVIRYLTFQKIDRSFKRLRPLCQNDCVLCGIGCAERMRIALTRHNSDLASESYKYIWQITSDNDEGKRELDKIINPEEKYAKAEFPPSIVSESRQKVYVNGVDLSVLIS